MLVGWLDNGAAGHLRDHAMDPAGLLARTRAETPGAAARTRRLIDRFLDRVAIREPA